LNSAELMWLSIVAWSLIGSWGQSYHGPTTEGLDRNLLISLFLEMLYETNQFSHLSKHLVQFSHIQVNNRSVTNVKSVLGFSARSSRGSLSELP
jgi:hypothetical protein